MTEAFCPNEEMRDRLPAFVHGTLSPADLARVQSHVADCAACRDEVALLETTRRVLVASGPRLDTAAIVAAMTPPALRVVRGGASEPRSAPRLRPHSRGSWMPRRYLAAAASLLVIGSLAMPPVREFVLGTSVATGDSLADPAARSPDAAGLALAGGLADLSEDDLAALLADLEAVEPTVASEPTTLRSPLVDSPEGP